MRPRRVRTLFNQGGERPDIAVFLCKPCLRSRQCLFLLLVFDAEELVVVGIDIWCLVADDGLHVLILRLLLQVLELQVAQEGLS